MYESPIELLITDIQHQIEKQQDEEIYKAVLNFLPNVKKEELLRALQYDRDQYDKGYADGRRDAMDELVCCQDCEFCYYNSSSEAYKCMSMNGMYGTVEPDGFCSYGERREGE